MKRWLLRFWYRYIKAECEICHTKLIDWGAFAPSDNIYCLDHDLKKRNSGTVLA